MKILILAFLIISCSTNPIKINKQIDGEVLAISESKKFNLEQELLNLESEIGLLDMNIQSAESRRFMI